MKVLIVLGAFVVLAPLVSVLFVVSLDLLANTLFDKDLNEIIEELRERRAKGGNKEWAYL